MSRGGLRKPSDCIYVCCVHASSLNRYIFKNEDLKNSLLGTTNPRDTFIESFRSIMENNDNTSGLLQMKCVNDHTQDDYIKRVAFTIFNINAKNYVTTLNDTVHAKKKRTIAAPSASNDARKLRKIQSQGSS